MLSSIKKFFIEALLDGLAEVADSTIERAVSRIEPIIAKWQSQPQTLLFGDGMAAAYLRNRIKQRLNALKPELGDDVEGLYKAVASISPNELEDIADGYADRVIEKLRAR